MFLIFSHQLSKEQTIEAEVRFGIDKYIYLPENLQKIWSNIPPELQNISSYLEPIEKWLKTNVNVNDYVLIHGEFGSTYMMVNTTKTFGAYPIYSTTSRESVDTITKDGIQKQSIFKHCIYRFYL